jgi:hypothetical protein
MLVQQDNERTWINNQSGVDSANMSQRIASISF